LIAFRDLAARESSFPAGINDAKRRNRLTSIEDSMPLHAFQCLDCENEFESLVRSSDVEPPACPACNSVHLQQAVSKICGNITYPAIARSWRRQAYREGHMCNVDAKELKALGAKPIKK
jgi:putative FmdB family regulatory protein